VFEHEVTEFDAGQVEQFLREILVVVADVLTGVFGKIFILQIEMISVFSE